MAIVHTGKGRRKLGKGNSEVIELYNKDWGRGQPVVFSHGSPLSADV